MEIVESSLKVSDRENASIEGRDCEEKRREGREREARNDEFYEEDESESSPRTTTGKKKTTTRHSTDRLVFGSQVFDFVVMIIYPVYTTTY